MPCDAVLVHYSGYGYNKRGLPNWLTGGIKFIKTKYPNIPVATLFHELNAVTGKIWNSSFWLSPLQAHLCKTLALDSSLVLTTTKDYAEKLSGWHPQIAPLVIPVFSTIGEAKSPKPIAKRKRILAAFGTTKLENRLYADGLETLEKLVKIFQIAEIWDIGARNGALPHQIGDASVVTFGRCEADKISEMLNNAMFGLVDAPVEVLEKSTICAAHIANGAIPVMFCEKRDQNASGYYLLGSDTKSDVLSLEQLADFQTTNTTTYWQQRSLKSTTQRIANELFEKIPK